MLNNENGGQGRGNQNWVSGKRYRWTLTYDGRGGGSVNIADENGNDVGNVFMGTVTSGLRTGNAIRFRVRAQAGLGEATISATISQIGAEVIGRTLTTAGNNQLNEKSFAFTSPVLDAGFTASGTFTFSFKGQIPSGGGLQFLVDAGNATCRQEETAFIWTDHLNTPRQVTDGANHSLWAWDSTPFGETSPTENPSKLGGFIFNHRFPGQYFDQETGLHQNWNRDFDPGIGRYVQADPAAMKDGPNLYPYVRSNPVYGIDAQGLYTEIICWSAMNNLGSEFGHISVNINGANYSFGPRGWDTHGSAQAFANRQVEILRSGQGVVLNLTPAQEQQFASCMQGVPNDSYSANDNNCGRSVTSCLRSMGINFNGDQSIFPIAIIRGLMSSPLAIGHTRYGTSTAICGN
jgi:RHS repeat-associated protein